LHGLMFASAASHEALPSQPAQRFPPLRHPPWGLLRQNRCAVSGIGKTRAIRHAKSCLRSGEGHRDRRGVQGHPPLIGDAGDARSFDAGTCRAVPLERLLTSLASGDLCGEPPTRLKRPLIER